MPQDDDSGRCELLPTSSFRGVWVAARPNVRPFDPCLARERYGSLFEEMAGAKKCQFTSVELVRRLSVALIVSVTSSWGQPTLLCLLHLATLGAMLASRPFNSRLVQVCRLTALLCQTILLTAPGLQYQGELSTRSAEVLALTLAMLPVGLQLVLTAYGLAAAPLGVCPVAPLDVPPISSVAANELRVLPAVNAIDDADLEANAPDTAVPTDIPVQATMADSEARDEAKQVEDQDHKLVSTSEDTAASDKVVDAARGGGEAGSEQALSSSSVHVSVAAPSQLEAPNVASVKGSSVRDVEMSVSDAHDGVGEDKDNGERLSIAPFKFLDKGEGLSNTAMPEGFEETHWDWDAGVDTHVDDQEQEARVGCRCHYPADCGAPWGVHSNEESLFVAGELQDATLSADIHSHHEPGSFFDSEFDSSHEETSEREGSQDDAD